MTKPVLGTAMWVAVLTLLGSPVEARAADTEAPVITHVRITEAPQGDALAIRARIEDDSEIFAPSVYVRRAGTADYDNIAMRKVLDAYEAVVAAEMVDKNLEYFIEAFDEAGNGPAREGSPDEPIQVVVYDPAKGPPSGVVTVPPPPPDVVAKPPPPQVVPPKEPDESDDGGVLTAWWFWTIVGVAVAGGATAAVVLTRGGDPVDEVDIVIVGPDPTAGQ